MTRRTIRPVNFVTVIIGDEARVENVTPEMARELKALGGWEQHLPMQGFIWTLTAHDDESMGRLLSKLRDLGAVFAAADKPEWSPAGVFRRLRQKGLVHGEFKEAC